ncbi:MAG: hypothetical protein IAF38_22185 [Bacteroidia bacterium]|nr:hypothetical protein [Bacteroidia bacterium]
MSETEKKGLSIMQKTGTFLLCPAIIFGLRYAPHGWHLGDTRIIGVAVAVPLQILIYHLLKAKQEFKKKDEFKRWTGNSYVVTVALTIVMAILIPDFWD